MRGKNPSGRLGVLGRRWPALTTRAGPSPLDGKDGADARCAHACAHVCALPTPC